MMKDPVCGMMVDEKKTKLKSDYNGKTYYFCAKSCKETFDKGPAKFVKKPSSEKSGGCSCSECGHGH